MDKKSKKRLICISVILMIIAIVLYVLLNQKPSDSSTNSNNQNNEIDTSDIAETSFNWEDIVDVSIIGDEGNLTVEFTYKEIPDLRSKIDDENSKWEEKRGTLDSDADKETIQTNLNWLEELNKLYSTNYCEAPADLNNHSKGDTIKITCDSETLRKLNYKFNDGFEYTLSNIYEARTEEEIENSIKEAKEAKEYLEKEAKSEVSNDTTENNTTEEDLETEPSNYYDVIGNTIYVLVEDINTVNLYQQKGEDETMMVVVNSQSDFEKVKEFALSQGNIDYIQFGLDVYDKDSDFKEAEEWKGFSIPEN